MRTIETLSPRTRVLLVVLCLVVLAGMLAWYGTLEPDAADNNYPGPDEISQNPEAYLGEQVSVSGTVLSHDPLRIEAEYGLDGTMILTITGVENPPPIGHSLKAFGTLTEPDTVHAQNTITRAPWEIAYMYVISFLGGLWVLIRLARHWRPERETFGVVPRGESDG